ncbi:MAG: MucR family transcriptional regulator [Magnetococcales bacterium]|nr:MucR family transcriptional regulator [Magnetococcales bacterium]
MSLTNHTAKIVEAYVSKNKIAMDEIPSFMESIHNRLLKLESQSAPALYPANHSNLNAIQQAAGPQMHPTPAVDPKKAVSHDTVTCLICGKPMKALKGHLSRTHGVDVISYRKMFKLKKDFPIVAPSYSEKRRRLAMDAGLGAKLTESRKRKSP